MLALLESAEEDIFSTKECAGHEDRSRGRYLRSGHATNRATMARTLGSDVIELRSTLHVCVTGFGRRTTNE